MVHAGASLEGIAATTRRPRAARESSDRRAVRFVSLRCGPEVIITSVKVFFRFKQPFFTHPSVSTFDRVPFQLTEEPRSRGLRRISVSDDTKRNGGKQLQCASGDRVARARSRGMDATTAPPQPARSPWELLERWAREDGRTWGRTDDGGDGDGDGDGDGRGRGRGRPWGFRRLERARVASDRCAPPRNARAPPPPGRRPLALASDDVLRRGGASSVVALTGERAEAASREKPLDASLPRRISGAFYITLVPIRPRSRGERRSLRISPGVSLRPPHGFNPRPRCLSTPPSDAFELHPDVRFVWTITLSDDGPRPRAMPRRGTDRAGRDRRARSRADRAPRRLPRGRPVEASQVPVRRRRRRRRGRGRRARPRRRRRDGDGARADGRAAPRRDARDGGGGRAREGTFYITLVPIRPRSRGERRSLRTSSSSSSRLLSVRPRSRGERRSLRTLLPVVTLHPRRSRASPRCRRARRAGRRTPRRCAASRSAARATREARWRRGCAAAPPPPREKRRNREEGTPPTRRGERGLERRRRHARRRRTR